MVTEFFMAVGVFPVELLAYQISMVCVANCPRKFIYIVDIILGRVYNVFSHIIFIFYRNFKFKLMQIFTNGERRFYSFMEFYVIHWAPAYI